MALIDDIYKAIGKNDGNQDVTDWLSSGCIQINKAIGGSYDKGFPVGRIIEIFGSESCISGDTFIQYKVINPLNGKIQNSKGGTIERLYNRFHKISIPGQGNYKRKVSEESEFYLSSVDDDGFIVTNRIKDVVKTGEKECFRITTLRGHTIEATKDHRFWNGKTFEKLEDLSVGDVVCVHENTPYKADSPVPNVSRRCWLVKHHPVAPAKVVDGKYHYKRLQESRAIYEAFMNNMSLSEYRRVLNSGEISGLKFLSKDEHVHHIDENSENNDISNLAVVFSNIHGLFHATDRIKNLSFVATEDSISSIESVGVKETFDIKMSDPHRNYVANKFVVHNCGKTLLATFAIMETQARGGFGIFLDYEHAFSLSRAVALGMSDDPMKWIYKQPTTAEDGFKIIEKVVELLRKDDISKPITIVVDSVASMMTEEEMKADYDEANMKTRLSLAVVLSTSLKKLSSLINKTNVTLIFLNQTRDNPGVMFGSKEKTPGGNALKFYASVRVKLTKTGKIKDGDKIIGENVTAQVIKNKVAEPFGTADYISDLKEGINLYSSHIEEAINIDMLPKSGAWLEWDGKKYYKSQLETLFRDDVDEYIKFMKMFSGKS